MFDSQSREAILGADCRVWQIAMVVGVALQIAGWTFILRVDALPALARWLTTTGIVLALLGGATLRESLRTSRLDLAGLLPQHQAAATIGGFWLFALFLVLNAALIAGCILLVARSIQPKRDEE
jgi:hypothetical protein